MSNKKIINSLFADFIMNKIGIDYDTKIQVCSCKNFTIIKGETSSKEIVNLSDVLDEFHEKYSDHSLESKNLIDLIEYDKKVRPEYPISFTFSNDENCSIKNEESPLDFFNTSYFPYGHSFSCLRSEYYYFKKIVYSIPSNYPFKSIIFRITKEDNKIDFTIENDFRGNETNDLKSAILDCFDFDFSSLTSELKKVELDAELIDPTKDIEILKTKNPELLIL